MASAAEKPEFKRDPITVRGGFAQTERYTFAPSGKQELNFGSVDEPVLLRAPQGVSELTLQGRRCGDYYAEVNGPKGCRSSVGSTPIEAFERVAQQVLA